MARNIEKNPHPPERLQPYQEQIDIAQDIFEEKVQAELVKIYSKTYGPSFLWPTIAFYLIENVRYSPRS